MTRTDPGIDVPFWPRVIAYGGKLWSRCGPCGKIVRIKPFFGSIHICVEQSGLHEKARQQIQMTPPWLR